MALWQWSTTPANNASGVTSINWAEGQPPSTVNDSARQMMADIATWYQNGPEWLNYGLTPTYVNATQFTVNGNQTSIYTVGRRVRAFVTAGTIYGTVSTSSFASVTTVGVTWDSGNLDSGVSEVDVGILNPATLSSPTLQNLVLTAAAGQVRGINYQTSGVRRWNVGANNDAESGSNAGSSYVIARYDDSGNLLDVPLNISRQTGNITTSQSITANSDERLKENWKSLPATFVDRLAAIKSGTYDRKDSGLRQAGVSAQSLQHILPEAVVSNDGGILSVAYGNAALVACVELAKEVVRLRALVEAKK